jgi:hypothetical protein
MSLHIIDCTEDCKLEIVLAAEANLAKHQMHTHVTAYRYLKLPKNIIKNIHIAYI